MTPRSKGMLANKDMIKEAKIIQMIEQIDKPRVYFPKSKMKHY